MVHLDADKEKVLRSETSLIETIGRSARHVNIAEVVLYANKIADSMQRAMDETNRHQPSNWSTMPSMASLPKPLSKRSAAAGLKRKFQRSRPPVGPSGATRRLMPLRSTWAHSKPRCWTPPRSSNLVSRGAARQILELRSAQEDGPRRPSASPRPKCAIQVQSQGRAPKAVARSRVRKQ